MVGAGRRALDGITVPVLDMELAELESSSSSINGSGGGREESFVFANDFARSDMANGRSILDSVSHNMQHVRRLGIWMRGCDLDI